MVTDCLDDHVEDVPRLIQSEHDHHQHVAAHEGRVRDRLDAELQAGNDRERGTERDDGDHHRGSVGQLVLASAGERT